MIKPKITATKSIYTDSYIQVIHDRITYNKREWNQIYLDKINKNSVVVIPVEENGVYLIEQYRHAIRKFLWQFPAGTCENNLTSLQLAHKELTEETGMIAHKMKHIGFLYSEPGLSTDRTTVYCAEKLEKVKNQTLDHTEIGMNLCFFKFKVFDDMIKAGKITCGITLSAYFLKSCKNKPL